MQRSDQLKSVRYFLIPYLVVVLVAAVPLLRYSKEELHFLLNRLNHPALDQFFYWITHFGDGLAILVLFVLFLFIKFRYAFFLGISGALSGIITQILKRMVFDHELRPTGELDTSRLELISGVDLHQFYSFPSGHSTTAFTLTLGLCIVLKLRWASLWLLLAAMLVAYSRVYLSLHYLVDVYAGSVIGVGVTMIVYLWPYPKMNSAFYKRSWLGK